MPKLTIDSDTENFFAGTERALERDWEYLFELSVLEVAEKISKELVRQKLTRADLARRLGVSRAHITQLLRGTQNVRLSTLFRLATAVGLTPRIVLSKQRSSAPMARQHIKTGVLLDWSKPQKVELTSKPEALARWVVRDLGTLATQRMFTAYIKAYMLEQEQEKEKAKRYEA